MATTQKLSTELILDAVVSPNFTDAFSTGSKLLNDLSKHSNALERDLKALGKSADHLDSIGDSSKELRRDMSRLEKQIDSTNKAVDKFGDAKMHFRNARIGASSLKNELSDLVGVASKAAIGVAAIGTAAAVALAPPQELMDFDSAVAGIAHIAPDVDATGIENLKLSIRELSNETGIATNEIASRFHQLTRSLGFEDANQVIDAAVNFEIATGTSIEDIAPELATARISLGIDTAGETRELLKVLQAYHAAGGEIQNLDLGDLETLMARTGEDIFGENLQRELLTTLAFRQVDSFQLADHLAAYQEEFGRSIVITPEMNLKEIEKANENLQLLEKYGLDAEKGLLGAMRVFQSLDAEQRSAFREQLSPVLGEQTVEVIARGSAALGQVDQHVTTSVEILQGEGSLSDAADDVLSSWSATWGRIGTIGQNTMGILQESFASTFGPQIVAGAERLFDFLDEHQEDINKFFVGVQDTLSPIINKVWNAVTEAWPDVKQFATEVWGELRGYWESISPVAGWLADKIWSIAKAIGGFLKDHPKLVATVIAGIAAFKAYKIASTAVQTGFDFIAGGVSLVQGHFHRLHAIAIGNQRELANTGNAALSTGRKFLEMGKNVLATKFPRFSTVISGLGRIGTAALGALPGIAAMGSGLWAAMAPILPVVLPIIAAIGVVAGLGYLIYKNWDGISSFFSTHFETIRNALMFVFPPLGILIGLAGVIKENWEPLKAFFTAVWGTVERLAMGAFEGIQFIVLGTLTVIKNLWTGMTGFFSGIWDGVKGIFIDSPLAPIFTWMVDGIKKVFGPLGNFFTNFWDNISNKVGDMLAFWTEKFEWFNKILDKGLGWLRDKNKEMKDDLGFKTEAKVKTDVKATVDMADTITPEAKSFIHSTYDINLDKVGTELASELSSVLTAFDSQEKAGGTPDQLEMVNARKQKYLDRITLALPEIEDRRDKKALEKVAEVLKKDLRVDSPYQDSPYQMDFKPPTEFIQQVVKGDNLLKPLGDILIEAKKQTGLLAKIAPSAVKTEKPIAEQQQQVVNVANPNIEQAGPIVNLTETQAGPIVNLPEQQSPVIAQPTIQTPVVNQQSPVVNVPKPTLPEMNIEKPLIQQERPIIHLPKPTIDTPVVNQAQPIVNVANPNIEQDTPIVKMPETQSPVIQQPTIETPVVNQDSPIVSMPETQSPVIQQPTIAAPVVNQDAPIVSMPETQTSPVIQQPTISLSELNVPAVEVTETQPVVSVEQVIPKQTVETTVLEGSQDVNLSDFARKAISVGLPTETAFSSLEDLDIPSVEIMNPDGTFLDVEQLVQDSPVIETADTMPYTPVPASPTQTPTAPQTTQIHNETANTDGGKFNITFHMNITQAPGEDGEAFAERVAAIIRQELNSASDSFLTL